MNSLVNIVLLRFLLLLLKYCDNNKLTTYDISCSVYCLSVDVSTKFVHSGASTPKLYNKILASVIAFNVKPFILSIDAVTYL